MLLKPNISVINNTKKETRLCFQLLTYLPKTLLLLAINIRKNVIVGNRMPFAT